MKYTLPSPVRIGWLWYKLIIYLLPSSDAFLSVFLSLQTNGIHIAAHGSIPNLIQRGAW